MYSSACYIADLLRNACVCVALFFIKPFNLLKAQSNGVIVVTFSHYTVPHTLFFNQGLINVCKNADIRLLYCELYVPYVHTTALRPHPYEILVQYSTRSHQE